MKKSQNKILIFVFTLFIFNSPFVIHNCLSQWVHCGLGTNYVYCLYNMGNFIFAGTDSTGVYYTSNNGLNWVHTSLNNRTVGAITSAGYYILAGTEHQGAFRSTDEGASWSQTSLNNQSVRAFVVDGINIYAGTLVNGVYSSTNSGTSWVQHNINLTDVLSLSVNGNNIFAGTNVGVWKSTNNGINWAQTSLTNGLIHTTVVSNNILFASFSTLLDSTEILRSTNNGLNWQQTSFHYNQTLSLLINGNNFFVGSAISGFFLSTDYGISWQQHNEGLPQSTSFPSLCIFNNWLYGGTYGYGIWKRNLAELIGITPISKEVPTDFALSQNYPNPFNPVTTIEFNITSPSPSQMERGPGGEVGVKVSLSVFDITGREVATLVNESLQPGKYKVDWNASNYSSGIYFYKLVAGDFISTKKMILLK